MHIFALILFSLLAVGASATPFRAQDVVAGDDSVEFTIASAREDARADRNAESARLFGQVISRYPERRRELLREWADQLCYSGQATQAAVMYRELLSDKTLSVTEELSARRGLALALSWSQQLRAALAEYEELLKRDDNDSDAQRGRARVLSWMGRHGPAVAAYRQIVARHPDDIESARDIGRVESWRGRQKSAQRELRSFLEAHPDDAEARRILAQSLAWTGQTDDALLILRRLRDQESGEPRTEELINEISLWTRQEFRVVSETSVQSDGLRIDHRGLNQIFRWNDGRTSATASFDLFSYIHRDRGDSMTVNRKGGMIQHRFNGWNEIHAGTSVERIAMVQGESRMVPVYTAWWTATPGDRSRFDLSLTRTTFDNKESLRNRIASTTGSLSMDFKPTGGAVLSARFRHAAHTDGNTQHWMQIEVQQKARWVPQLNVGFRFTSMGFATSEGRSYFSPMGYRSASVTAHGWGRLGKRLSWELDGSAGAEESDRNGRPIHSISAKLTWNPTPRVAIDAAFGRFASRQNSSGGFARSTNTIGLRYNW